MFTKCWFGNVYLQIAILDKKLFSDRLIFFLETTADKCDAISDFMKIHNSSLSQV